MRDTHWYTELYQWDTDAVYNGRGFFYNGMFECLRGMLSSFLLRSILKSLQITFRVFSASIMSSMKPRCAHTSGLANLAVYSAVCSSRSYVHDAVKLLDQRNFE